MDALSHPACQASHPGGWDESSSNQQRTVLVVQGWVTSPGLLFEESRWQVIQLPPLGRKHILRELPKGDWQIHQDQARGRSGIGRNSALTRIIAAGTYWAGPRWRRILACFQVAAWTCRFLRHFGHGPYHAAPAHRQRHEQGTQIAGELGEHGIYGTSVDSDSMRLWAAIFNECLVCGMEQQTVYSQIRQSKQKSFQPWIDFPFCFCTSACKIDQDQAGVQCSNEESWPSIRSHM